MKINYSPNTDIIYQEYFGVTVPISIKAISGNNNKKIREFITSDQFKDYKLIEQDGYVFKEAKTFCRKYIKGLKKHSDIKLFIDYPENGMNIIEQQKFLSYLIEDLLKKLPHSIDIILYTQSLFILTDIPIENITFINTWKPKNENNNTFGGNLYDILSNLSNSSAIANISNKLISNLIQKKNNQIDYTDIDNKIFEFIGDRIIKGYINRNNY